MRALLLGALVATTAVTRAVGQTPAENPTLGGVWRLDSLRVAPGTSELSDSAAAALARYTGMISEANAQFASGAVRIVTEYGIHGRYTHRIFQAASPAPAHADSGRYVWTGTGAISCLRDPGPGFCPHHGARVVVLDRERLVLELDLPGPAAGLREMFWLTRINAH